MDVIIDEKSKLPNYQKRRFEHIYILKKKTGRKCHKMLTESGIFLSSKRPVSD